MNQLAFANVVVVWVVAAVAAVALANVVVVWAVAAVVTN
jgi:hypothetical protein